MSNRHDLAVIRRRPNFAAVPYELVDDETISATAKAVYMILDRFADYNSGATFVGKERIAKLCGYSKPDSVDRYLNELRDKGWITSRRRWRKAVDGRGAYEYSYSSGPGFEPTTSLHIVNDRVTVPEFAGEGIPPTAGIGIPPTAGQPIPPTAGQPIPPTAGTNENQVNENQGKGVAVDEKAAGGQSPAVPSPDSSSKSSSRPAIAGTEQVPSDWCTADAPRCRAHAHIPPDGEVPACRPCASVREWFEAQARSVVEVKRRAIRDCGFCDDRGMVDTHDSSGRPVAAVCGHQGPPQPVGEPRGHKVVSDPSVRRAALRAAMKPGSGTAQE